ncbi:phosphoadenosine phosphosulfate reductase [Rhodovulum adriaticum]|uniref:Phosphoadenosine phosphosulfate reductase n=1 Tax=Rhodovulum adriaticum TaxID=35804 RepID=A0A4R2NN61_RHOAD|nr:phosphoadenosine phosphosulfate reductase [Rhodovulum adriaticum]MBK1634471.1 hypothetical protein [Rhodovulum adriaticum]TCP23159.1 hypothetical protein EV656_104130 [Rhodovulum adriaticum]
MDDQAGMELVRAHWQDLLPGIDAGAVLEPLGTDHAAILARDEPVLLVTFEDAATLGGARADGAPLAATLTEAAGWSRLTLVARERTWFRDPDVYAYFDQLVDEGFFDEFDRVVFYGTGMCGYAAAAFSVAAPGATVIVLNPQATLTPEIAGWDDRFRTDRRRDFTTRYGYAPAMAEAAAQVFVIHDPTAPENAMHAALFSAANVTRVRAPRTGHAIETQLMDMGVLPELIDAAGEGQLSALVFHRLFRARRRHMPYLRSLLAQLQTDGQIWRAALVCRHAVRERSSPRFRRRLEKLEQQLAATGRSLPPDPQA